MSYNVRAAAILFTSVAFFCCPFASALNPALDVSQYAHKAWKISEGFPTGLINAITQTPDGYLWLGTEFGLYHFDGVQAVAWQPPPGQQLPSSNINSLLAAKDGTLWIGTWKGLASLKKGKLTLYPELNGHLIGPLLEDREGTIWAGTFQFPPEGKLCAIQPGSVHCYGKDDRKLVEGVFGLYQDRSGTVWAGVRHGLWRWKPGPPEFYPLAGKANRIEALAEDDNGTLLTAMTGRVVRLVNGKTETVYSYPDRASQPRKMLRDRHGGLWIGTVDAGLVHIHQGRTGTFTQSDGLSSNSVIALFEDREGNVWAGTTGGLDRFRDSAVVAYSAKQGMAAIPSGSLLVARNGRLWFDSTDGLTALSNGVVRRMTGAGVPDHDWFSLFEDHGGRIWLAGFDVTGHLNRERIVSIPGVPGGRKYSMAEDTSGSLWIATLSDGLIELRHDTVVQQIPWATFGDNHQAIALAADSEQGGLWLGFYQSGLAYFKDGRVRASYTAADGLGHGAVSEVSFDRDGALWVATEGGLSHLKNGRVATLTKKNGLPCDEAVWAIEDNARSLWVYMACGLVRISGAELAAWASDRNRTINRQVFDTSDGVRNRGIGQSMSPSVGKSPDGKIWFMNADTVSVIDPQHIPFNKVPPPVHIEQITANGKAHDASRGLRLPPLIHDISIDYTALSFAAPEKVHFRFKLEGQDQDWREVVNVRQVQYSNLAPRNYRFRVIASNEGGVWNETGDTFEFSIDPAYYQTDWFKACLVVAFFVMLFGLYRYRLYQFAQEFNGRLEERVDERTRIARELHDTLLQSFHGLMLRFQGAHNLLPSRPAEARQVLETAIDDAAQAITEARDAVQDLRSSTVVSNDLARAVTALGEELAAHHTNADGSDDPVAFSVEVEGTSRDLQPILRDDIYRITGEALRNALRHARARRIEVELHYDERELRVRVRDDGIGIDRGVQNHEGLSGHFGMTGMRERAKRIGGKLEVWGELGAGTEVELRIPASIAYQDYAGRGFRLFRRRVGTPS